MSVLLAMLVWGYALFILGPVNPPPLALDDPTSPLLYNTAGIAPEPLDKFMFVGLALALPFLLIGAAIASVRQRAQQLTLAPLLLVFTGVAVVTALVCGVLEAAEGLINHGRWVISLLCVAAAIWMMRRPLADRAAWVELAIKLAIAFSVAILILMRLWPSTLVEYSATFTSHYEAATFATVRIAAGQTCLAEVIPQYGCFGEYLSPIFAVLGRSVLAISGVFLALQLIAVVTVFTVVRRLIQQPVLQLACMLCLMVMVVFNLSAPTNDPILQYYPVRFLFAALSLLLVGWVQRGFTWQRAALAGLFGGVAITWNLESGLAVCLALAVFVTLGNFAQPFWQRRYVWAAVRRGLIYSICASAYVAGFLFYLHVKSGGTTQTLDYFVFQITFYLTGFGMIPIPSFPDYWTIHACLIVTILVWVAMRLARGAVQDQALEKVAYLAVLAIGLTLYYTGRSHWLVLKLVAWPDMILFFFLLDRAGDELSAATKRWFARAVLLLPALYIAAQIPGITKVLGAPYVLTESRQQVQQDITFIKEKTEPGESVYILAPNQGILHGETDTLPALKGVGLAEMLRKIDLANAQDDIVQHGPQKVFISSGLEAAAQMGKLGANIPVDFALLSQRYALAAWGPDGRLMYLHRKPYSGEDLFKRTGPAPRFSAKHAAFRGVWDQQRGGEWGRPSAIGMTLPQVLVDESFALKMRVVPASTQTVNAYVVSNYCCASQGFAIRRDGAEPDRYVAMVGDAAQYHVSSAFTLPADRESVLEIDYVQGHFRVRVNGKTVVDEKNLVLSPAPMPLILGGWYAPGELFRGEIREVAFYDQGFLANQ